MLLTLSNWRQTNLQILYYPSAEVIPTTVACSMQAHNTVQLCMWSTLQYLHTFRRRARVRGGNRDWKRKVCLRQNYFRQRFQNYRSKMVETPNISVEINNKSESIYKNTVKNEGNDLNSLISHLKSMQQKINEVLTKLVQTELSSNQNEILADEDSDEGDDSDDEDEVLKAKKCKYK